MTRLLLQSINQQQIGVRKNATYHHKDSIFIDCNPLTADKILLFLSQYIYLKVRFVSYWKSKLPIVR